MSNLKTGLKYIPLDIDFFDDPKILRIEEKFGIKGGYITIKLLQWIYRDNYYVEYSEDFPYIFAKRVGNGISGALVDEVVAGLLKCGFFNNAVFKQFQILTSRGIQKRWLKVITDCKRTAKIKPEYNLLNSEECEDSSEATPNLQKAQNSDYSEESQHYSEEYSDYSEECIKNSEFSPTKEKNIRNKKSGNITTLPNKDIIPKKKKEKTTNVVVSKNPDFIDELLDIFSEEYKKSRGIDFELTSKGKERKGIGRLLLNHKKKKPDATTEQTKADFRDYIRKCLSVNEDFHYRKMSPSHIADNINEINQLIKGKKPTALTNQKSFTDKQMDYDETWKN